MISLFETCVRKAIVIFVAVCSAAMPLSAQRDPVLKQIDVPHPYYFREMYLPQLTTGPGSVAWMPDSRAVVYSMRGTLWKQASNSDIAEQITDGPGYDYQPDCSRDAPECWFRVNPTLSPARRCPIRMIDHLVGDGLWPGCGWRRSAGLANGRVVLPGASSDR